jgi:phosphate transport system substrate-binding protein
MLNVRRRLPIIMSLALGAIVPVVSGCGGGGGTGEGLSGTIQADGSSTVGPFTTKAAEDFQRENAGVRITVGISGTGGGFERFCRDETDLSNASRPIKDEEAELCEDRGVAYLEFQVVNDALTNVVNTQNDWATCLTVEELNAIWKPGSTIKNWQDVREGFPDVPLKLYGAGTDSGTFDYFTEAINGASGASRSDFSPTEDDNVTVQGVKGDKGALGYFGFSYYEENADDLVALEVDGGDGCVAPSIESAQDGSYTPLSRPLFIYAKLSSFERQEVEEFIRFALENAETIATEARFVPLSQAQIDEQLVAFEKALEDVTG